MKATIFNFLVLQAIIWSIVFSGDWSSTTDVNNAMISDTWGVVNKAKDQKEITLHYPTFNKLTLNIDGTYERLQNDNMVETGMWNLNNDKTLLLLSNVSGVKKYEIIQLPDDQARLFIIKEKNTEVNSSNELKYELTRL